MVALQLASMRWWCLREQLTSNAMLVTESSWRHLPQHCSGSPSAQPQCSQRPKMHMGSRCTHMQQAMQCSVHTIVHTIVRSQFHSSSQLPAELNVSLQCHTRASDAAPIPSKGSDPCAPIDSHLQTTCKEECPDKDIAQHSCLV